MGKGGRTGIAAAAAAASVSRCGATLEDFRASGRLGCSRCWTTFERPLRDLLRRVHGATRHNGTGYDAADITVATEPEQRERARMELREQLRVAIEAEEFERAAELRDQLRAMQAE